MFSCVESRLRYSRLLSLPSRTSSTVVQSPSADAAGGSPHGNRTRTQQVSWSRDVNHPVIHIARALPGAAGPESILRRTVRTKIDKVLAAQAGAHAGVSKINRLCPSSKAIWSLRRSRRYTRFGAEQYIGGNGVGHRCLRTLSVRESWLHGNAVRRGRGIHDDLVGGALRDR